MLITATTLQNPNESPSHDAAIWIQGDTITFVGPKSELPAEATNDVERFFLKDMAVFPGLINAHCHLELSLENHLDYPGNFVDWIQVLLTQKNQWDDSILKENIERGSWQSLLGGATTVADHASFNADFTALKNSPLRLKIFLENLGVTQGLAEEIFNFTKNIQQDSNKTSQQDFFISPHSVHALHSQILKKFENCKHPLSIHLLESETEFEYFSKNSGDMYDFIASRGEIPQIAHTSPIQTLAALGMLSPQFMAVHMNYASQHDLQLLAQYQSSIVHCPLSHEYFQHQEFPLAAIQQLNINIALGSDSLASSRNLSMLEIMRVMLEKHPQLSPMDVFGMATQNGAQALGMGNSIGKLAAGYKADLIAVPYQKNQDPLTSLFAADSARFVMVGGKMLLPPVEKP